MKFQWTTYLLLVVVAAVWGLVAWKIFRPVSDMTPLSARTEQMPHTASTPVETVLQCDYLDPFLKKAIVHMEKPTVRPLPASIQKIRREPIYIEHLGTISSGRETCYIVVIEGDQHELHIGEATCGYTLTHEDNDSIYFEKQGIKYGVIRCK